ncbi:MAG TPA: glyoxalase superfamily protein [Steroidobacteraceae bacterium]
MFTQKNAKTMAKSLRVSLGDRKVSLSHSACLEIVARQLGFADWNTLSAKLPAGGGVEIQLGEAKTYPEMDETSQMTRTAVPWSTCSFCGKSRHEIRSLIGGCGGWEAFRASRGPERSTVFICDECATYAAQHFANGFGGPKESGSSL